MPLPTLHERGSSEPRNWKQMESYWWPRAASNRRLRAARRFLPSLRGRASPLKLGAVALASPATVRFGSVAATKSKSRSRSGRDGGGGVSRAHAHLGGGRRLPRHRLRLPRRRALPPLPRQELMLLGFISFLLSLSQGFIIHICIPETSTHFMLPCKKENLRAAEEGAKLCKRKGDVPLLSLEALHQLHIFIFVLGLVHVVFCATTILLGGAKIKKWKHWETGIHQEIQVKLRQAELERKDTPLNTLLHRNHQRKFVSDRTNGFWMKLAVVSWIIAFLNQFYDSVSKSDYEALRSAFVLIHYPKKPDFDFHKYMMRVLEHDFKRVVGISWYMWLFVIFFLLLNINGWHTYFWLAFLPLFVSEGFGSCMMEEKAYAISRLVIGVIIEVICSYITLPLYAIVTHMSGYIKLEGFGSGLHEAVQIWATDARSEQSWKKTGGDPDTGAGVEVSRAPNQRFGIGSSRSMLTATPPPDLDEIVTVDDGPDRQP
ncbi:MLO-like protein 13 isoform X4 [Phragmites australis]|uniref:MLO-like protein 13 isoform X4 n=1 Tax=Phragmites australis TaxID=29695 RepID=UPI002D7690C9|nr:MLO-like protein 13 isoform X4 [Phragmites australis]